MYGPLQGVGVLDLTHVLTGVFRKGGISMGKAKAESAVTGRSMR